jgi:hypothetical protein
MPRILKKKAPRQLMHWPVHPWIAGPMNSETFTKTSRYRIYAVSRDFFIDFDKTLIDFDKNPFLFLHLPFFSASSQVSIIQDVGSILLNKNVNMVML